VSPHAEPAGAGSRVPIAHRSGGDEPISRWASLLVVLVSLPLACIALLIGLATDTFWADIGFAWITVLGILALIVQLGVSLLNRIATSDRLPRAQLLERRSR
jgi:hypothetical protein